MIFIYVLIYYNAFLKLTEGGHRMYKKIIAVILILFLSAGAVTGFNPDTGINEKIIKNHSVILPKRITDFDSQIKFVENRGQLDNEDLRYYSEDGFVWFTDDGVWLRIADKEGESTGLILKQVFIGANKIKPVGRETTGYYSNFFYGNDPSKWQSNVPSFKEVFFENIYDGIDLRYYSNEKGLKYDLIVHPGADIGQIKITYEGANALKLNVHGDLIINTPRGKLSDYDLYIFQERNEKEIQIDGRFKLINEKTYSFEIDDSYNPTLDMVIDPALEYSTYIGGLDSEHGKDLAVDNEGNAILVGWTNSYDFPRTPGVINETKNSFDDIFILKFDPVNNNLLFSTYLGGSYDDNGNAVEVDGSGNIYFTGVTRSADFPMSADAFNKTHSWTTIPDIFVAKINKLGTKILYSTFIGVGEGNDLVVDSLGNAYVTGMTYPSPGLAVYPVTPGAFDETHNGFDDVFVFKINQTGSSLYYSTFIGTYQLEEGRGIAVDSQGNAYVTGVTNRVQFPVTDGAYNNSVNNKNNIFVLKLNWNGSDLVYSSLIGGTNGADGEKIVLDSNNNAIITGNSPSTDFPTTPGAFDEEFNGGTQYGDAVILKMNYNGSALNYSTFFGGGGEDKAFSIDLDKHGNIYLTGFTRSSSLPLSFDAYDRILNGTTDCFFTKLSESCTELIYSTYYGGSSGDERSFSVIADSAGNAYITGYTVSDDIPITPGAINSTYKNKSDVFLARFSFKPTLEIRSVSILLDDFPVTDIYSKMGPYNFMINITDNASFTDIESIRLFLDPLGTNLQLKWDRSTGKFLELLDPNDYIELSSTSSAVQKNYDWTLNFNLTFNWTYPDEDLNNIQIFASSSAIDDVLFNKTNAYRVENDLDFQGTLTVEGEDGRIINSGDFVRGGEELKWDGLIVVYEGYYLSPPQGSYHVSIWDENLRPDSVMPGSDHYFQFVTTSPEVTDIDGYVYIINITKIPQTSDASDVNFTIRIDADNVTFSNPLPGEGDWQTTKKANAGITITDIGGAVVNGSSIMYSYSTNNGTTWIDWTLIPALESRTVINATADLLFDDGTDNLVKWKALDSLGNGPAESGSYRISVDTQNVTYSNVRPSVTDVSTTGYATVEITISDLTSGVNASSIEYSKSDDNGESWGDWVNAGESLDDHSIAISLNLTFPNGTDNRIKWRAKDVAGNGPFESPAYTINIDISAYLKIPTVILKAPLNGFLINDTRILLEWELLNENLIGVTYDLYFDEKTPPSLFKKGLNTNAYEVDNLKDGVLYYWKVIPIAGGTNGICQSGVWWFKIDIWKPPVVPYNIRIDGQSSISLFQGESKSIELTISNLGTENDEIEIEIQKGKLSSYADLNDYTNLKLDSNTNAKRTLILDISENVQPGNYDVNVTIKSLRSETELTDFHVIKVEVKEKKDNVADKKPSEGSEKSLVYAIIVIIIIIVIAIALLFIMRKRKAREDESMELPEEKPAEPGTYVARPEELAAAVAVDEQLPAQPVSTTLPGTVTQVQSEDATKPALVPPSPPVEAPPKQLPPKTDADFTGAQESEVKDEFPGTAEQGQNTETANIEIEKPSQTSADTGELTPNNSGKPERERPVSEEPPASDKNDDKSNREESEE